MSTMRRIEIFSAGCPACNDAVTLVKAMVCPSCEVVVLDMREPEVARRAGELGIRSVPAVAVDGTLASCCAGRGPDRETLAEAGVGRSLP